MNAAVSYFNLGRFRLFLIMTALYILIIWLSRNFLINETVFYNSYSEQLTWERAMNLFNSINRLAWINYGVAPMKIINIQ